LVVVVVVEVLLGGAVVVLLGVVDEVVLDVSLGEAVVPDIVALPETDPLTPAVEVGELVVVVEVEVSVLEEGVLDVADGAVETVVLLGVVVVVLLVVLLRSQPAAAVARAMAAAMGMRRFMNSPMGSSCVSEFLRVGIEEPLHIRTTYAMGSTHRRHGGERRSSAGVFFPPAESFSPVTS
jgi:hypothetical protein